MRVCQYPHTTYVEIISWESVCAMRPTGLVSLVPHLREKGRCVVAAINNKGRINRKPSCKRNHAVVLHTVTQHYDNLALGLMLTRLPPTRVPTPLRTALAARDRSSGTQPSSVVAEAAAEVVGTTAAAPVEVEEV